MMPLQSTAPMSRKLELRSQGEKQNVNFNITDRYGFKNMDTSEGVS